MSTSSPDPRTPNQHPSLAVKYPRRGNKSTLCPTHTVGFAGMLVTIFILAVAILWKANASPWTAFSNGTNSSLPVVDLDYTLQQASSLNVSSGYYSFTNIRYGQPPIGRFRFAPPVAAVRDRTVQTGDNLSRRCYQGFPGWLSLAGQFIGPYLKSETAGFYQQYPSPGSVPKSSKIPPADPAESEDCLFLDVFVPETVFSRRQRSNKAPVLVWIHGGGYTIGWKDQYSAEALIKQSYNGPTDGVIFVALNYRLGAFGWLAGGGAQANAGLLDQRLALQWVKKYIGSFGGDPNRVTVIGESAGAGAIMHHLTANSNILARAPLFQQAVLQSPFFFPDPGPARNEEVARQFLRATGVNSLSAVKTLPAETLRTANYEVILNAPYGQFIFGPVIDHAYITSPPTVALSRGGFQRRISQIIGHNAREGIGFTSPWITTDGAFNNYLRQLFPSATRPNLAYVSRTIYPPPSPGTALSYTSHLDRAALLTSDAVINCNTYLLALAYANQTYNYFFNVGPGLHGDDLHYTFGPDPSTKNLAVQNALQTYVMQFAATGDPNRRGLPRFAQYGPRSQVLDLKPGDYSMKLDPAASDRCLALQQKVYAR